MSPAQWATLPINHVDYNPAHNVHKPSPHCHTLRSLTVNPADEVLESIHLELDARLSEGVVVLYAVQQLGEAPEAVCLQRPKLLLWQVCQRTVFHFHVCTRYT